MLYIVYQILFNIYIYIIIFYTLYIIYYTLCIIYFTLYIIYYILLICQIYPNSKDPQHGIDDTHRKHVLTLSHLGYLIVQFAADLVVSG